MIKRISMIVVSLVLIAILLFSIGARALYGRAETASGSPVEISAKAGILIDASSGKVVMSKEATKHLPIASMVKIMTLTVIFDEVRAGNLKLTDDIVVSDTAFGMGGSQAFLDRNCAYSAGELVKSIIVASANDSCVAMAEHISGSVEGFVDRMNQKAASLGMTNTNFVNCTGLPAPNQYSCAQDVSTMFARVLENPEFFEYSNVWMYDLQHRDGRITQLTNTNKLVRFYKGCDGGKTGFTSEAMHCLSATAKRGNTRLIAIVIGAKDSKTRFAEVSNMLNHGFANYESKPVVDSTKPLEQRASVTLGKQDSIGLKPSKDFLYFARKQDKDKLRTEVVIDKLVAPVKEGQIVGKIVIYADESTVGEVSVVSTQGVATRGYLDLVDDFVKNW